MVLFYREKVLEMFRHAYNSYMVSIKLSCNFEHKHPLLRLYPSNIKRLRKRSTLHPTVKNSIVCIYIVAVFQ